MTCFKKLITFLTLTSFFFVGEAFAGHHLRDKEIDTSRNGVKPSSLSHKEKKQYRKETKRQIKATKLPRKQENRRRESLKKQIAQEKHQQRKEQKLIKMEQKENGSKKSNIKTLTISQAQDQINTLLKQFEISKKFKDSKKYMESIQSLKRAYPTTIVPPITLHVTKKKKSSFGKSKKSESVYMMGPQTNYEIVKI